MAKKHVSIKRAPPPSAFLIHSYRFAKTDDDAVLEKGSCCGGFLFAAGKQVVNLPGGYHDKSEKSSLETVCP